MRAKRIIFLLIAIIWLLGCFTILSGSIEDKMYFDLLGNQHR